MMNVTSLCCGAVLVRDACRAPARWVGAALAAAVMAMAVPALAQDETVGGSFITPFPANDIYQVQVIGDSLGEGLLYGVTEVLAADTRLQIRRKTRSFGGLMKTNYATLLQELDDQLTTEPADISIVMVGAWDRISVRGTDGNRILFGSPEWRAEYVRRVDQMMRMLRRRNSAIYWVGLPPMRRPQANEQAQIMNEIVRERAYLNGQKYVDTYANFIDESGGYTDWGPDLTGKILRLRDGDGLHFTGTGYRKLAHFIERELKRDIAQAKNERSIPLAGNEAEQSRVNPQTTPDQPAGANGSATAAANPVSGDGAGGAAPATVATPAAAFANAGEQKADNSRVSFKGPGAGREETVTVDILRPAIASSVIALVTRRESPDKPSQMGEALIDLVAGGLTIMNSITPASETGVAGRRKLSPTQSPFFRVLVKGERLASKAGRADDASWPRPEPLALDPEGAASRFSQPASALNDAREP